MSGEIRPAIGDFPAGSRIAGYQIEQLIGRGGMAVVYRAADVRLDRLVALKVLAPELARDDAFRRRFIHESRSGAAVDHPNVIPVFEAGEAEGVLFIAMRYVTGGDVRGLIDRESKLPPARVVSIITQVASALDAAHAHGLIHRDVKPANMLLATVGSATTPDHIYLSDFGLSKLSVSAVSLTGTGQFLGTLDYMSPEQVEGRPVDGRTDLYALACAAFEMLTGQPPFQRDQNLAVMWAQVSASPPSVREFRPELPPQVDEVLAKALAKSPANRHASCLEFAADLKTAIGKRAQGPGAAGAAAAVPGLAGPATELAAAPPLGGAAGGSAAQAPRMPAVGPMASLSEATVTEATPGVTSGPLPGPPAGGSGYGSGYGSQYGSGYGPGYATGPTGSPSGPPSGSPSAPPGGTHLLWQGESGYQPGVPPGRRRGKALPFFVGVIVILALAGAALLVLHLRAKPGAGPGGPAVTVTRTASPSVTPSSPSTSPTQSATPQTPDQVVNAYFSAINNHQYHLAWRINQRAHSINGTFANFKAGFVGTQSDVLTSISVSGDVATVKFNANQTDGSVKVFQGTYTVQNGQIVDSRIVQIS